MFSVGGSEGISEKKSVFEKSSKIGDNKGDDCLDGKLSGDGSEITFSGGSEMIFSACSRLSEGVCCDGCCCWSEMICSDGIVYGCSVGVTSCGCSKIMFSEGVGMVSEMCWS